MHPLVTMGLTPDNSHIGIGHIGLSVSAFDTERHDVSKWGPRYRDLVMQTRGLIKEVRRK